MRLISLSTLALLACSLTLSTSCSSSSFESSMNHSSSPIAISIATVSAIKLGGGLPLPAFIRKRQASSSPAPDTPQSEDSSSTHEEASGRTPSLKDRARCVGQACSNFLRTSPDDDKLNSMQQIDPHMIAPAESKSFSRHARARAHSHSRPVAQVDDANLVDIPQHLHHHPRSTRQHHRHHQYNTRSSEANAEAAGEGEWRRGDNDAAAAASSSRSRSRDVTMTREEAAHLARHLSQHAHFADSNNKQGRVHGMRATAPENKRRSIMDAFPQQERE